MTPDIINGTFELFGGVLLTKNVLTAYRDKQIKGVHWLPTAFFTAWGGWNLYYYPYLDQWFSFVGGIAVVSVNAVWVGQFFYYRRRNAKT